MSLFKELPGFVPSAPGLEHLVWRRLPAILLWGTLLPLVLAGVNRALAPAAPCLAATTPRCCCGTTRCSVSSCCTGRWC